MQLVDLESIPVFLILTSALSVNSYQAPHSMHLFVNSYRSPLSTTRGKVDGVSLNNSTGTPYLYGREILVSLFCLYLVWRFILLCAAIQYRPQTIYSLHPKVSAPISLLHSLRIR